VTDFDDMDHDLFIQDFVDDPVQALPDPIGSPSSKADASLGAGIFSEFFDPFENVSNIFARD
jgi:hypothetical protein